MSASITPAGDPHDVQVGTAPRQPQPLIVSLFALYGRAPSTPIPVSAIVNLMVEVEVDEAATRSALMRLKRAGVLQSVREGVAGYQLNPELEDVFREGDERIYAPKRSSPDDPWVIVSFSVPESQRNLRYRIRRILSQRGFGTVSAGLWIAPAPAVEHLRQELRREELLEFAEFFIGHPLVAPGPEKIQTWWDIAALEALYTGFIERFRPVQQRWRASASSTSGRSRAVAGNAAAFADYLSTVTAWRRLPFLDPGIPLAYLPNNWQGRAAEELFADIHDRLASPARQYVTSVIGAI